MRVSWVIRNVNMWFARVVYSRDAWDEWLVDASEETDFRIGWIFYIARLAVFLSRGVLWCFMMLSHAATCWLSRQMEYDADRYETRLAGSQNFEQTCFQLRRLAYGLNDFMKTMRMHGPEATTGNPVRDLMQHCDSLSEEDEERIQRRIKKAKTGLFDTHPADSQRIEEAMRENAEGVFHSDLPAEAVFQKFDRMCASLTML